MRIIYVFVHPASILITYCFLIPDDRAPYNILLFRILCGLATLDPFSICGFCSLIIGAMSLKFKREEKVFFFNPRNPGLLMFLDLLLIFFMYLSIALFIVSRSLRGESLHINALIPMSLFLLFPIQTTGLLFLMVFHMIRLLRFSRSTRDKIFAIL